MTARYRGPNRAKVRLQQVRSAWAQLMVLIGEEQEKPGFCGPDAREIEEIGDRALAEVDDQVFAWLAKIAAQPRGQAAKLRLREALGRR